MKTYKVTLKGLTPMLLHNDNIEWAGAMSDWEADPTNKKKSVKGDDRSPAWRWIGGLYVEGGDIVVPSDNLMTMMREGAVRCPTGKGKGTFKSMSQSGIIVNEASWPIVVSGKRVPYAPFKALIGDEDYEKHEAVAKENGFFLFAKRARVGTNKHVRVRARFDEWKIGGTITVLEETITSKVFSNLIKLAGSYAGLCDWRPSSPRSPGRFGQFEASIVEV
jgi:hypothetical protein